MSPDYDIIIAGGGMVGASLACALREENVRIAVIEPVSPRTSDQPSYDDRGLALSLASQRILAGLGLWRNVSGGANPIRHIHVSDRHRFGFVRLDAEMLQIQALGYVVIARELGHVLLDHLAKAKTIDVLCPATVKGVELESDHAKVNIDVGSDKKVLTSRLIIIADGTHSDVREMVGIDAQIKDYHQTAIVTNVTPGNDHNDTAYERFTDSGPMALLPLTGKRCVVVFTVNTQDADHYINMDDEAFISALQVRFGRRLGKFQRIGSRKSYPVIRLEAGDQVADRAVVLGNSAHTIHPNGAQGFNLGLRDVAGLAEVLVPALREGMDVGRQHLLERYMNLRRRDQRRVIQFSDGLASLFYNDLPHKVISRNLGMLLIDVIPTLKRSFLRRMTGLHGKQPALVRGVSL